VYLGILTILFGTVFLYLLYVGGIIGGGKSRRLRCEPGSEASPLNRFELDEALSDRVANHVDGSAVVLYTSVNAEAALHNLPPFLESLAKVEPPLINSTIVLCLDVVACSRCALLHHRPSLCVRMDLGISDGSLAPGGNDAIDRDYWRLTFGRVYATLKIHALGKSVLPLDVDSVMLKNPFTSDNALGKRPNDLAATLDVHPFSFQVNHKETMKRLNGSLAMLNGGFLYFPATSPSIWKRTGEILKKIWSYSCKPKSNEQWITTKTLREVYEEERKNPNKKRAANEAPLFDPQILPKEQYPSFCNTNCGSTMFAATTSLAELEALEKLHTGKASFHTCEAKTRRNWVFFHAACITWPEDQKAQIAKAKGLVQRAILLWVAQSRERPFLYL